ncbi:MAG TPA: nitroreductase/quinone reductase family protein [Galbitalea sp.]|jgi:deazaflavin-dependent oxidoreductase (nitroreductase family)
MSDWNDKIIKEFHDNNGVVGGPFAGAHLLLLTTVGAKSGEKRTSPMMYFPNGNTRIVVASKAGADTHPHWYHNLMKNPEVHVEASIDGGIEEYDAVASPMPENERVVKYAEIGASNPGFAGYQEKTSRKIPLVILNRVD